MCPRSLFPPTQACRSGHNNICFHSWIFGGIRTSGPGSWRMGVHVGGTRPLISFSQRLPLTSQYPIWAWPGLRGRAAWKGQRWEREREAMRGTEGSAGGREGRRCGGGGTVGSKLKGLTGWLLLWNVPLTAKTRPPTAACYRQVHGRGEAGGGWLVEREAGWLRWCGGKRT